MCSREQLECEAPKTEDVGLEAKTISLFQYIRINVPGCAADYILIFFSVNRGAQTEITENKLVFFLLQ